MIKILALYLPQFHEFKENNEWWGKGFTEWVNTKKAKPLYITHYQPKEPLNDNYYDLLDDDVRIWQDKLANKYGIDGFVYYHYWFNGKKLMEKPIEKLLKNKSIKTNFCISWANEPWTRSWDGKSKEIIMPQHYGDKKDWDNHFYYLLDFFKDERYIKENNKPLLFIYRIDSIKEHEALFNRWDILAKDNGFDGISIVETLTSFQNKPVSSFSEHIFYFEPMYTQSKEYNKVSRIINSICKIPRSILVGGRYLKTNNYDMIWKKIINRKDLDESKKVIYGAFPGWDNTARRGNKAKIIEGSTPRKFGMYMKKLIKKAQKNNIDYIIINAWNEWAEGAYLEPDKKNEYSYLEQLKESRNDFE